MKSNYFVVSKPLRYLNITNIPGFQNIVHKRLIVINQFCNADAFFLNVCRYDSSWEKVVFVQTENEAYLHLLFAKISNLYVFVDCSIKLGILYILKHMKVILLEEGIGSYSPQEFVSKRPRIWLRRFLHVGLSLGSSTFIDRIYVYRPDVFLKVAKVNCEVLPFKYNMLDFVIIHKEEFCKLFSLKKLDSLPKKCKVLLYITEWSINQNIINFMEEHKTEYDMLIIKPHPHIKFIQELVPIDFKVLSGNMMAEFLIVELLSRGNELTICHCGSTSVVYFMHDIKSVLFPSEDAGECWRNKYIEIIKMFYNEK